MGIFGAADIGSDISFVLEMLRLNVADALSPSDAALAEILGVVSITFLVLPAMLGWAVVTCVIQKKELLDTSKFSGNPTFFAIVTLVSGTNLDLLKLLPWTSTE